MESDSDSESSEFLPRPYQEDLLRIAMKTNTILYLPTGSGKTYIAVMLIKALGAEISNKNYEEGAKRSFFLVNNVALVDQQANYLEEYTNFKIGRYSGDKQCDFWKGDEWAEEFAKYNVLVMTAQIFLNVIQHGYFEFSRCNLIIFDECHHAVDDHPMRQIMIQLKIVDPTSPPLLLGLTATLLNRNVKPNSVLQEVSQLEITYLSKIATVEALNQILGYSTNPKETCLRFSKPNQDQAALQIIGEKLDQLKDIVTNMKLYSSKPQPTYQSRNVTLLIDSVDPNKKIWNTIQDISFHAQVCGLFGASMAILAHIIQFERLRKHASDEKTMRFMQILITSLTATLKISKDSMENNSNAYNAIAHSSPKVQHLIEIFVDYVKNPNNRPLCALVFVEKRFTAKILYYIFRCLKNSGHEDFKNINPDFLVGFNNNPFNDTRELVFERKQHLQVVEKFKKKELNVIFATNVIEEGIDFPQCTLVVMFDFPSNYRSYIQSKGRARHKDSEYIIMVPEHEDKFLGKYVQFQQVERILQNMLTDPARRGPSEYELMELDVDIDPYVVESTGASATLTSSIALVNRYCTSLPHDALTVLAPLWYKQPFVDKDAKKYIVSLELPIVSGIRHNIYGPPDSNIKNAKRAAALEAIKLLHQSGELNDHLLPPSSEKIIENVEYLFPNWLENDKDNDADPEDYAKAGTKKRRRRYVKKNPNAFNQCSPLDNGDINYLHIIEYSPVYEKPNESNICNGTIYNILKSKKSFAILSSKPLPNLCDFSLYISSGEVNIHLILNQKITGVDSKKLKILKKFHSLIFGSVLNILKPFLVFDNSNEENSYLVVPVKYTEVEYEIDLELAQSISFIEKVEEPTLQQRRNLTVTSDYLGSIVYPWYRTQDTGYVVCEITHKLNALSPFPHQNFSTFVEYYKEKWNISIESPTEPLLLVKGITNHLNYLKPGGQSKSFKRKTQDGFDFEEYFLPELCIKMSLPSIYWLKAKCLPTILHRINYLLLADELRRTICLETKMGVLEPTEIWQPLKADSYLLNVNVKEEEMITDEIDFVDGRQSPVGEDLDMKKLEFQRELSDHTKYPWKEDQEPIDIERHIDTVTLFEIEYYHKFVTQPVSDMSAYEFYQANTPEESPTHKAAKIPAITYAKKDKNWEIQILNKNKTNVGPQLWEVVQALTAAQANDIVNLERNEILGDSFLKFGVSLYLTNKFPNWNEGWLTLVKGRILGNRNLFYCGRKKSLGTLLKVNDFEPNADWFPPSFCVPRICKEKCKHKNVSSSAFYSLDIPRDEQCSGVLSLDTERRIIKTLNQSINDQLELNSLMEDYLCQQIVNDKTIADGVEAIIGCYLRSNGVDGAFSILEWLDVLPRTDNVSKLMYAAVADPLIRIGVKPSTHDIEFHIPNWRFIEDTINYHFENIAFLLQALTHPSYSLNKYTGCYQRLEFIGDAILDFLITCHIYEQGDENMKPGDVTDLRSALVNNVVFASLSVKYGLHKNLLMLNPKLTDVVLNFARHQKKRNHVINEEVLSLLEEADYSLADYVDVPKVLGDLFEAMIGAVFLDSGMDLKLTWKVIYGLMKEEIIAFTANIPKNPIRLLYEAKGSNARFLSEIKTEGGICMAKLSIYIDGKKKIIYGFGDKKKNAKRAAAKIALRAINANKTIDEILS